MFTGQYLPRFSFRELLHIKFAVPKRFLYRRCLLLILLVALQLRIKERNNMLTMRTLVLSILITAAFVVQPALSQDKPRREQYGPGAKCLVAKHHAAKSDAITKEQADAIVSELKLIRQL